MIDKTNVYFIGGVGGSGTRVVANLFQELGFFIGSNLNKSLDNLDWPGSRHLILDAEKTESEKQKLLERAFIPFAQRMAIEAYAHNPDLNYWVCKVPGCFYFLPYLAKIFPRMRYIHVMRNGLDMAFSANKNQVRRWGKIFGIYANDDDIHKYQLRYWLKANTFALAKCQELFANDHLIVEFERLCFDKDEALEQLLRFIGMDCDAETISRLTSCIETPKSIGRHKKLSNDNHFEAEDLERFREFNYSDLS